MLRRTVPTRSCSNLYASYQSYRPHLKTDFNNRCGYCDICNDVLGGSFQIDHFAPKKAFPRLQCEYSNLVYSCPSCNRAKWDHWPMEQHAPSHDGKRGFIDPCEQDYDDHLERSEDGSIRAKTELGVYICGRLKLRLRKHRFLWLLDRVMEQCDRIQDALGTLNAEDPEIVKLREIYAKLLFHYHTYHRIVKSQA
jgi:uncharacterized protein (TIGR02646 family)